MHATFTGSSRRPRQVNLSGRVANPFAAAGAAGSSGHTSAVLNAQQERERRQLERDRLNAAKTLQRYWRGHRGRTIIQDTWRQEWDEVERQSSQGANADTYPSEEIAIAQIRRLNRFFKVNHADDVTRLLRFWRRLDATHDEAETQCTGGPWPLAYLRSQRVILSSIQWLMSHGAFDQSKIQSLLQVSLFVARRCPESLSANANSLYHVLALCTAATLRDATANDKDVRVILQLAISPLSVSGIDVYIALACRFVATLDPGRYLVLIEWYADMAKAIKPEIFAQAVAPTVSRTDYGGFEELRSPQSRLNLLASLIYFHNTSRKIHPATSNVSHQNFVRALSALLSSVADHINLDELQAGDSDTRRASEKMITSWNREQILSLVNQESIGSLLSSGHQSPEADALGQNEEAQQLASYALTLLRFFPRRGDEIRMWLYLGSNSSQGLSNTRRTPTIRYFWQATRLSSVFDAISKDSRSAVELLKSPQLSSPTSRQAPTNHTQKDWTVILVFFELYTFVLKLMDDEEFFASSDLISAKKNAITWAGQNALPLDDIRALTTFLKNLGFTMYFNAKDLVAEDPHERDSASLSTYFNVKTDVLQPSRVNVSITEPREVNVAGLPGMSIDYVKGLVTGLLRMIYERDSRRKFLPKDHWLMTSRFDMTAFIPSVVQEEENRHRVQEEDDADVDDAEPIEDNLDEASLIGTHRTQHLRMQERLQRQQRKASRRRFMQAVAPRLEILQNMPFFVPFETRVQIFREFVHLDQLKRRKGFLDADTWRAAMMHDMMRDGERGINSLMRHQGRIRRGHEFEDAYEQFNDLKDGLKEPIQITFVDQFDQAEAGIDGGGVTKEFLTSVTGEAFTPSEGFNLFVENDQHLLYPNPAAWEERRESVLRAGYRERSSESRAFMTDLKQRYEFLGRIVGKCLYEGILVDVNFAGFFLLKWALTGGTGSAPRESGYRANLNDLRDLDEGLYQGLLQLKNYSGDVEDFALNFTITDTITTDYSTHATKTITKPLKPDGTNIAVTNANRLVYISYVARHRLQIQPAEQTSAFLRGLSSMIQPSWLGMFNQSELQTLLSGSRSAVDVADLRAATQYGGLYVIGDDGLEHPTVQAFWRVMESFSDEDRRAVLKFVTSTPRAPLLGFSSLKPRFSIRDSGNDERRLPSTSTCVNLLKLPVYRTEQTLREKLLAAVHSGAGFDLS